MNSLKWHVSIALLWFYATVKSIVTSTTKLKTRCNVKPGSHKKHCAFYPLLRCLQEALKNTTLAFFSVRRLCNDYNGCYITVQWCWYVVNTV